MPINVLVFGSGGREHAICEALLRSKNIGKLCLAMPNDGFKNLGENIEFENFEDLAKKSKSKGIDLLVVGGEEPLCEGIIDVFKGFNIKGIGVDKMFSQLESSKLFAKNFMNKYGIKNAKILTELENPPYVIKENGLAKGKGVYITSEKHSALEKIKELKNKEFFIEEFLEGEELSLISLFDGKNLLNFVPARDFKRLYNSTNAPNTGGMGSFCPVHLTFEQEKALRVYTERLKEALKAENADFTGFIYSGLIWHEDDFWVLEYNVRLGDPEAQSLLTHLESDFLEILIAATEKKLDKINLKWKQNTTATLVLASEGYPFKPLDGNEISGIDNLGDVKIYYSGVKKAGGKLFSKGGRNLCLSVNGVSPFETLYKAADKVKMEKKYYRKDLCI